jgi:hypothetical protein
MGIGPSGVPRGDVSAPTLLQQFALFDSILVDDEGLPIEVCNRQISEGSATTQCGVGLSGAE